MRIYAQRIETVVKARKEKWGFLPAPKLLRPLSGQPFGAARYRYGWVLRRLRSTAVIRIGPAGWSYKDWEGTVYRKPARSG